jgi:hypothetical protein
VRERLADELRSISMTNWIEIGSLFTGGGAFVTGALAGVSWRIASGTKKLATATEELAVSTDQTARATQALVETAEEPFVIATPADPAHTRGMLRSADRPAFEERGEVPPIDIRRTANENDEPVLLLKLWNIGHGPAIVVAVSLTREEESDPSFVMLNGSIPLGAGMAGDYELPSQRWPQNLGDRLLTIRYMHASGRTYETVSLVSIGDPIVRCRTYTRGRVA